MVSVEEEAVLLAEAAQVVDFSNISTSGFNMPLVFSLLYGTVVYRIFALVVRMLKANALVVNPVFQGQKIDSLILLISVSSGRFPRGGR